jgi:glycosyltransferase involved in cell wall biosynthesis
MAALRIAHILPWPGMGGVELATLRLTQTPFQPPVEHIAYCLPEAAALRQAFQDRGWETPTYRGLFPSLRHPQAYWQASRQLAQDLRARRIDLVHCSDVLAVFYAALAAKLARLPLLCHVRCKFDVLPWRERMLLSQADHFAFVSQATRDQFVYAAPDRRSSILYDAIDLPAPDVAAARAALNQEFGIAPQARIIGMVARVAPAKDFETLLQAAAKIVAQHPEVRFVIVGDHSSAPEYRQHFQQVQSWLQRLQLEPYFVFTGHRSDVIQLIAAMDVFTLVTHSEGAPLVVLEAMALGKPVVATRVGGIPELIDHGVTGFLHPPGEAAPLAQQLTQLLEDPGYARGLGEAARESVERRFSVASYATALGALYRTLAAA